MLSYAAQQPPAPEHGGADVHARIDEILSRPEFRRPGKPLVQRVLDAIGRRLGDLFEALTGGGSGTVVAWVIVIAFAAVAAVMVARLIRSLGRDPAVASAVTATEADIGRPATAWRAEADAHEAAQRWRDAIRCRYRALVVDLAGRGVVDEVPGRTSGEYRREVAASVPTAATDFSRASDIFDVAWYGAASADSDDAAGFRALEQRVLSAVS